MIRLFLLLLFLRPLVAQDTPNLFRASQMALLSATALDVASSRGGVELNPIAGRGDFQVRRQGAIAIGITVALVLAERRIVQRWPAMRRTFTVLNFAVGGAHVSAAAWNWRQ